MLGSLMPEENDLVPWYGLDLPDDHLYRLVEVPKVKEI